MTGEPAAHIGATSPDAVDLEQALTMLAWSDPAVTGDPVAVFTQLGVQVPAGWRVDLRIQRPDTPVPGDPTRVLRRGGARASGQPDGPVAQR